MNLSRSALVVGLAEQSPIEPALESPQPSELAPEAQHFYVIDSPTAWTVGWSSDIEELRAKLRTKQGIDKVHRQFYHISATELCRVILPLFDRDVETHIPFPRRPRAPLLRCCRP